MFLSEDRTGSALALGRHGAAVVGVQPNELDRRRIEHALERRKRYRYVSPSVYAVHNGYLIKSPCCSRNIHPEGGIIDIALLQFEHGETPWRLYRKDHRAQQWHLHSQHERLVELLELLITDPERQFWQ